MVVLGSWAHIPFSWSQLSSVLQQPRSFPRSCWSALSSIAPEEDSLGPYQEMQAKATTCSYPLQGAVMVMKLLRHTREKSIFYYVAPMQDQFSLQLPPCGSQWDALKFISISSWVERCFVLPWFVLLLHPLHDFSHFRLSGSSSV